MNAQFLGMQVEMFGQLDLIGSQQIIYFLDFGMSNSSKLSSLATFIKTLFGVRIKVYTVYRECTFSLKL
jgi:hypothetical protein